MKREYRVRGSTPYSPNLVLVELYNEKENLFATVVHAKNDAENDFPAGALVEISTQILEQPKPKPELPKKPTPGVK
jgi:hypothetical protein